ncbi:MAG: hypothetical protein AB1610_08575 [Nitrospirota bacterium]
MKFKSRFLYCKTIPTKILQSILYGLLVVFLCAQSYPAYSQKDGLIPVNVMVFLDGFSKEQIFAIRKSEVEKHGEIGIFPKNYEPSSSVFGQVQDREGWVKDVQFFINNPYLLVLNSSHPYVNVLTPYCDVPAVTYSGRKITETYRGEAAKKWFYYIYDYYKQNNRIIRLWFANAYDAGFRFAHIDKKRSLNVDFMWKHSKDSLVSGVYSGNEFFHVGHLAKNNISPRDEKATIRLLHRDTKTVIYIKLWRNKPSSRDATEDFAYIIRMEP